MKLSAGQSAAIDAVEAALGDAARRDVPLGPLTTYRVGGRAALIVEARSVADLRRLSAALEGHRIPLLVIGNGSNLLVAEAGFAGVALVLRDGEFEQIRIDGTVVTAGGAVSLPVLARRSVAAGLTGLEWAVGVPGSVGGAVVMNAGGHGSDMAASLVRIRVVDLLGGEDVVVDASELNLAYRSSDVARTQVVVDATFELAPGDAEASERMLGEIVSWRRENQPGGQNAGSVFRNPAGDHAGRLIDEAGCKGLRVRSAHVSEKHANFIQVETGGSADDVIELMRLVQERVVEHSGVVLLPETRVIADSPGLIGMDL